MKKLLFILMLPLISCTSKAQTNIISTNSSVLNILKGAYNPTQYNSQVNTKEEILIGLKDMVSADTLKKNIITLAGFKNRNTCSDTLSAITGIGASRNWVYRYFQNISAQRSNRLQVSFLQFDQNITSCPMSRFKNIFCVLPGADTTDKSIVLVEGHIDTRCEDNFSGTCLAEGVEDNATGTALVMELARVMSMFSYKNTIVFLVTIGEEQGLYGAEAFARYCADNKIKIKAVQNNDVIGGIYCGKTASPPTACSGATAGSVDSTHVRIFSFGDFTSFHKSYARFAKLEYLEEMMPIEPLPHMDISIMTTEDRTGRGGDHIPFDGRDFTAIRFTASHEHGDANSSSPTYTDRQHSFRDTLGVDKNNDGKIDSFYISFTYLKRNTIINGTALAMAAIGPKMPEFADSIDNKGIHIRVINPKYLKYKVNLRRKASNYDLGEVYTFTGGTFTIQSVHPDSNYYVSLAAIDDKEIESIFTAEDELRYLVAGTNLLKQGGFSVYPNPSNGSFIVSLGKSESATVLVTDISGREIMSKSLSAAETEINLPQGAAPGIYFCHLFKGRQQIGVRKLSLQR